MAKCTKPTEYGRCRKCNACLQSRLRSWQLRMIMESMLYDSDQTTFLTLTYRNENLPADADAAKKQFQKWLKRLRKVLNLSTDVRYVAALEQGTQGTKRYHWHCILYGPRFGAYNRHFIEKSWANGFIQWKPATHGRMAYVLKYVIKGGKFLMSRRPGIGDGMIQYLNNTIDKLSLKEVEKAKWNKSMIDFAVTAKWDMPQPVQRLFSYIQVGKYPFPLHAFIKQRMKKR